VNNNQTFTDQSDDERLTKRNEYTKQSGDSIFKPKKNIEKTHKTKKEHIGKKPCFDQENDSRLANGAHVQYGPQPHPTNNFYNNNYTINYNNYENITQNIYIQPPQGHYHPHHQHWVPQQASTHSPFVPHPHQMYMQPPHHVVYQKAENMPYKNRFAP